MPADSMAGVPVTQIIYLTFNKSTGLKLEDTGTWAKALDHIEKSRGVLRIYWGRSLEHPEHGQLHIGGCVSSSGVRSHLEQQGCKHRTKS
jgi:hypothetical protein